MEGAPQPADRAPEGRGRVVEVRAVAVNRFRPGALHGLESVGEVLEYHVVQLAGYVAALGLPDLTQILLGFFSSVMLEDTPMTPATSPLWSQ